MSFFEDLKKFHSLTDPQISSFVEYANSRESSGAKDFVLFEKFIKEAALSEEQGRAINRIVGFLADFIITEKTTDDGIAEFEKQFQSFLDIDENAKIAWGKFKETIKAKRLESFILYRKEQRLKNQVPHIHNFSLVCDARPVFDLERQSIIKYLFPITLKIENHEDEISLYELDEEDLFRLKKEVESAINKIKLLRTSIGSKN